MVWIILLHCFSLLAFPAHWHCMFADSAIIVACHLAVVCSTGGEGEIPWCFSQVKGTIEDEVADGKDT